MTRTNKNYILLNKNPPNPQNLQLKKGQKIKITKTNPIDYKGKQVLVLEQIVPHSRKLFYFFPSKEQPTTPFSAFDRQKNHAILEVRL